MIVSLAIGVGMFGVTLCVLMVPTVAMIRIATSRGRHDFIWPSNTANVLSLLLIALLLLVAHLANILLWATLFFLFHEFSHFEDAFYHSAVNYSSLGYGDLVMSPRWRLLGPLETIDGMVMFGISTALIFAVLSRMIERRLKEHNAARSVT